MVGAFSVGKTSLIQRYVHSIFTDAYLSTIGVKISKKKLSYSGQETTLMLWDLEGKDDFVGVNLSYLRGASGLLLVADGTRAETLEIAMGLRSVVFTQFGSIPHRLLVNKADLSEEWEILPEHLSTLEKQGVYVSLTSAKTGQGVEEAFLSLAEAMS